MIVELGQDMIQERHFQILRRLVLGHDVDSKQAHSTLGYFLVGNGCTADISLYGATSEILSIIISRVGYLVPREKCVMPKCGAETEYTVLTSIYERVHYVEGIGQLCETCYKKSGF